jgi:hypothetical protein
MRVSDGDCTQEARIFVRKIDDGIWLPRPKYIAVASVRDDGSALASLAKIPLSFVATAETHQNERARVKEIRVIRMKFNCPVRICQRHLGACHQVSLCATHISVGIFTIKCDLRIKV